MRLRTSASEDESGTSEGEYWKIFVIEGWTSIVRSVRRFGSVARAITIGVALRRLE